MFGMKSVLLFAVVCVAGTVVSAEGPVNSGFVWDPKYRSAQVDAEFVDGAEFFDLDFEEASSGRKLQQETVTKCNTWCMLKNSIGKTIIGLLFICIAPYVIWKNEGRHVTQLRRIDFCKNNAVVLPDANNLSDEFNGQLVHFVGEVSVDDDAIDLQPGPLNITNPLNCLVIKRTVMIFQKFEQASQERKNDTIGAGQTTTTTFTVREDWTPMGPQAERLEHLQDETNSRGIWDKLVENSGSQETAVEDSPQPAGLPPELAALLQGFNLNQAPHGFSVSEKAHVGGFGIAREMIIAEPAVFQMEWSPCPTELVPDAIESLPELRKDQNGNLTTIEEGSQPQNGDVMIKYEYCPDGFDTSFIVQQINWNSDVESGDPYKFGIEKGHVIDDKCCKNDDLGDIWMIRRGRHDLAEMIEMAKEDENTLTKIIRLGLFAILVAGWMFLFSIFTTLLSTLPILGTVGNVAFFIVSLIVGTVCCCGVTAVAYVRYRPLLAIGILALAGGIAGIVIWRLDSATEASSAPTPVPTPAPTPRNISNMFYPQVYDDAETIEWTIY